MIVSTVASEHKPMSLLFFEQLTGLFHLKNTEQNTVVVALSKCDSPLAVTLPETSCIMKAKGKEYSLTLAAGISSLGAQFAKLRMGLKHLNFSKTSLSPKGMCCLTLSFVHTSWWCVKTFWAVLRNGGRLEWFKYKKVNINIALRLVGFPVWVRGAVHSFHHCDHNYRWEADDT